MRYARPTCDECVKLAAESAALYQEFLNAKDLFKMTPKNDRAYLERRNHLGIVTGQLGEARKREDLHESSHQDRFSNSPTT
jgi:hypothetical protein